LLLPSRWRPCRQTHMKSKQTMAISARSRFAGFLRGLMGRADDRVPTRPATSAAPAPAPAPASAPRAVPPPALGATAITPNSDEIELPLDPVVAGLPLEMRARLLASEP